MTQRPAVIATRSAAKHRSGPALIEGAWAIGYYSPLLLGDGVTVALQTLTLPV